MTYAEYKMITAEEAKNNVKKYKEEQFNTFIEYISSQIKNASSKGKTSVDIGTNIDEKSVVSVIEALNNLGYKVRNKNNSIEISWN